MINGFLGPGYTGATFDESRAYRYALWRRFWPGATGDRMVAFVGLNPSTADEHADDPTIRRCIGFAKAWGFEGLVMLNLFAFRATDPRDMRKAADPIGPDNDECLRRLAGLCGKTVCAWGAHGDYRGRCHHVRALLDQQCHRAVWHLGLTKDGHPKHPLYLRADTELVRWQ